MGQAEYLFGTARWHRLRKHQLRKEPFCRICSSLGKATLASVADHVVPHYGNVNLFYLGELQSLCRFHHNSSKKSDEARGYSSHVDGDGWPTDPRHPLYALAAGSKA